MNCETVNKLLKAVKLSLKDVISLNTIKNTTEVYLTRGRGRATITETKTGYSIKIENNPIVRVAKGV